MVLYRVDQAVIIHNLLDHIKLKLRDLSQYIYTHTGYKISRYTNIYILCRVEQYIYFLFIYSTLTWFSSRTDVGHNTEIGLRRRGWGGAPSTNFCILCEKRNNCVVKIPIAPCREGGAATLVEPRYGAREGLHEPHAPAYPDEQPRCGRRRWYSTSSTVHTAPFTFSTRIKHLCRERLCLTAFYRKIYI